MCWATRNSRCNRPIDQSTAQHELHVFSLIPRPYPPPVLDWLQYAKSWLDFHTASDQNEGGEGVGIWLACIYNWWKERKPIFNKCVCSLPQPDHSDRKPSHCLQWTVPVSRKEVLGYSRAIGLLQWNHHCMHPQRTRCCYYELYVRRQASHTFTTPNFLDFFRYYVRACICKQNLEAAFDSKWILLHFTISLNV